MKIKIECNICGHESDTNTIISVHEIPENQIFEFSCPSGHKNRIYLQNPRYELLFDMGIFAYQDGYYREACLDFAACIERFHEYCLYAMLQDKQELFQNPSIIEDMWKLISAQSERQYGAFVALYTRMFGQCPITQTQKYVEFRNGVTHKGRLPSKNETIDYAKYAAEYIKKIYIELASKTTLFSGNLLKIHSIMQKEKDVDSLTVSTFLSFFCNPSSGSGYTFEQAMEEYDPMFRHIYDK